MTGAGRHTVFWVLFAAIMVACHLWIDRPLAVYFRDVPDGSYAFFASVTTLANGAIWFSLAAIGMVYCSLRRWRALPGPEKTKWTGRLQSWVFVFVALLIAGAAVNILKVIIGRYRPRYFFSEDMWGFEPFNFVAAMNSFPSGHSQSICTAMMALTILFPRLWPIALLTAAMVSASRVLLSVHWLSDVLAGAVLGIGLTLWLARRFEKNGTALKIA